MTAPTAYERAEYVTAMTTAALSPGGPLYNQLSDLLTMTQGVAMRAAGVPVDPNGIYLAPTWPVSEDHEEEDEIRHQITNLVFQAALAHFRALDERPQPELVKAIR